MAYNEDLWIMWFVDVHWDVVCGRKMESSPDSGKENLATSDLHL